MLPNFLKPRLYALEDRLTVRQQIALATAALCVALVLVLAAAAAHMGRTRALHAVRADTGRLASSLADRVDTYLHARFHQVRAWAELPAALGPADPGWFRQAFRQAETNFPEFRWIGWISADGSVRAAAGGVLEGTSVAEWPTFQQARQGAVIVAGKSAGALPEVRATAEAGSIPVIDIAVPIRAPDGTLRGVVAARLDWSGIDQLRHRVVDVENAGRDTMLTLVSASGQVLDRVTAIEPLPSALTSGAASTGVWLDSGSHQGMQGLTAYARTDRIRNYPDPQWFAVAHRPIDAALAEASQFAWTIILLGAALAIVGVLAAAFIADRVAKPIRDLTANADRIGRDPSVSMLPRQRGSEEVIRLSSTLRSLLLRLGFVEQRSLQDKRQAADDAERFARDITNWRTLANTDPLTGLMNRRAFMRQASDAMRYFQRYKRPIATLIVDIDHFKRVNDRYGHVAGDTVIRKVADLIRETIRTTDEVARFGGEEFVVLLREVSEDEALGLAERIRELTEETIVLHEADSISVTVSIGGAAVSTTDRDVEDLIERADRALYAAKNAGRNCVHLLPARSGAIERAA